MIALSDLVILTVSGALLATGIYRWQSNMRPRTGAPMVVVAPMQERPSSNQTVIAAPRVSSPVPVTSRTQETMTSEASVADSGESVTTRVSEPVSLPSDISTDDDTAARAEEPAASGTDDAALYGTYIVRAGDSLSLIADNHGTSVDTLRRINDIEGSLIFVDQTIRYPLPAN